MALLDAPGGKGLDARIKGLDAWGLAEAGCPGLHRDGPTPHGRITITPSLLVPVAGQARMRFTWTNTAVDYVLGITAGANKNYGAPDEVIVSQEVDGGGFNIETFTDHPGVGGSNSHSLNEHFDTETTPLSFRRVRPEPTVEHLAGVTGSTTGCFGWGEFFLHYDDEDDNPWSLDDAVLAFLDVIDADQQTTGALLGAGTEVLNGTATAIDAIGGGGHYITMDLSGSTIPVADNLLPRPGRYAQLGSFNFDTSTTMADPGAGAFRGNSATTLSALAIDDENAGAEDIAALLAEFSSGTRTILLDAASTGLQTFNATAVTPQSGWTQISVSAASWTPPSNGEATDIKIARAPSTRSWLVSPPYGINDGSTALEMLPRTAQRSPASNGTDFLLNSAEEGWTGGTTLRIRVDNLAPGAPGAGSGITLERT